LLASPSRTGFASRGGSSAVASRQPPELLSYSFLDILACTVAAVLFVLMVMALRLAEVSPASLPQAELFELQARRAELLEALTGPSANEREQELAALRAEVNDLERRLLTIQRSARTTESAARKRLERLVAKRRSASFTIRPRATQATQKRAGITFDVFPDRVEVVDVRAGEPAGSPPIVEMTIVPRGSLKSISPTRGSLAQLLDRLDSRRQYVFAFLRAGAIPLFLKLRKALLERGFDIDWRPMVERGRTFKLVLPKDWKENKLAPRTD
jgi:hypothetical protein